VQRRSPALLSLRRFHICVTLHQHHLPWCLTREAASEGEENDASGAAAQRRRVRCGRCTRSPPPLAAPTPPPPAHPPPSSASSTELQSHCLLLPHGAACTHDGTGQTLRSKQTAAARHCTPHVASSSSSSSSSINSASSIAFHDRSAAISVSTHTTTKYPKVKDQNLQYAHSCRRPGWRVSGRVACRGGCKPASHALPPAMQLIDTIGFKSRPW
jgi:hypothetical protein